MMSQGRGGGTGPSREAGDLYCSDSPTSQDSMSNLDLMSANLLCVSLPQPVHRCYLPVFVVSLEQFVKCFLTFYGT